MPDFSKADAEKILTREELRPTTAVHMYHDNMLSGQKTYSAHVTSIGDR